MAPTPDTVPAAGDPGDETARRYRYQWTYAAIVCCMLLDETEDVAEVFCEHHEDVLIKYDDGTFSGLQIKTRESDQTVWKASDNAVKDSCARFARLEAEFPGRFRSFLFLTNHPLHAAGNGQDFRYVLQTIGRAGSPNDISGSVKNFLERVARKAGCTMEVAFTALSKASASDDLPKLRDIETRLVTDLTGVWTRAADCSYLSIAQAARSLALECGRASSLAHQDVLPAYLPTTANSAEREIGARIAGKRFNRARILETLEQGLDETAALEGDPRTLVEPRAGLTELLLKKLDAGGFSAVSRNSAEDLRDKADYLSFVWTKKYGRENGLQRHGHVRSLVLNDAARAFEAAKNVGDPFGSQMLSVLHERFQQRRAGGDQLYDCSKEHLEGFAYSLTSECKVQWSNRKPWETG